MKKVKEIITLEEISIAKETAESNFMESDSGDDNMIGFEFNGINIINPWMDESGRFELSDKEAVETYGLENVINFILAVKEGN